MPSSSPAPEAPAALDSTDERSVVPPQTPVLAFLSKSWGVAIGLGLGVALTLGATRMTSPPAKTESPAPASKAARSETATTQTITATAVKSVPVDRALKATGTVAAFEPIAVLSQATGLQIQRVWVDEGDTVRVGQVLVTLDDAAQQAQLLQARANVARAEARLAELKAGARAEEIARARETVRRIQAEIVQSQSDWELAKTRVRRNQSLEAEGAIARDRLDEVINEERNKRSAFAQTEARLREAQQQLKELQAGSRPEAIAQAVAQLAEAKAQVQIALTRLSDSKLVSPVSGKVAERFARVGDVTSPSQKLFTIVENNRLELQLKVPETQLPAIRPGQSVRINSEADPSLTLNGTVRAIVPTVDAASRQAIVKVSLPPTSSLKPGMFLSAAIVTDSASSLAIPMEAALPQNNGSATVYLLQPDGSVKRQSVKLGEVLPGDRVEIVEGLKAGDRVAVKGAAYLNDGDRVTVAQDI